MHAPVPIQLVLIYVSREHRFEGGKNTFTRTISFVMVGYSEVPAFTEQPSDFRHDFAFEVRSIIGDRLSHNSKLKDAFRDDCLRYCDRRAIRERGCDQALEKWSIIAECMFPDSET
ncbi:hypothetical protein V3C99_018557 [Haemonchus contortus]|uniref:DUF772 domain-containing protein n=1 Tax=Haemonchus contortus TaxID=6289 RepID=A0A7I4Z477_HAECO